MLYYILFKTDNVDEEEKLLEERKRNAKLIQVKAERVINKAPVRMQRIIRFRVMQGLTWDEVAAKMKGNCTGQNGQTFIFLSSTSEIPFLHYLLCNSLSFLQPLRPTSALA